MRRPSVTVIAVMAWVAGLVAALWMAHQLEQLNAKEQHERFESLVETTVSDVQTSMHSMVRGLLAARGAIAAAGYDTVSRASFAAYAQAARIDTEYPQARGVGFIRKVPHAQRQAFVRAARAESPEGFDVRELGPRSAEGAFVIQYIEPREKNLEALGLDTATEPHRLLAALQSARSGQAVMSAPITLVQASQHTLQSVLVLLPVYRSHTDLGTPDQRYAATVGWVYVPLQLGTVLQRFAYNGGVYDFVLEDTTPGEASVRLLSSPQPARSASNSGLQAERSFDLLGRKWTLTLRGRPLFVQQLRQIHQSAAGVALCLGWSLLVLVWWLMYSTRDKARALQLQQSRLAAIVDHSRDAILAIDRKGRVTSWNVAAERIFGYTAQEALGQMLDALIIPEDRHAASQLTMQRVLQGESVEPFDTERRRKDGSLVPVSISLSPVKNRHGQVMGVSKISRDITERRASQEHILQLNAALHAEIGQTRRREQILLDQALSTVVVTDAQGKVTLFNRTACALLGYEPEEVLGKDVMAVVHDNAEVRQRLAVAQQHLGRKLSPGELFLPHVHHAMGDRNEWLYVHKDGTRIPMLLTVGTLQDDQGRLSGFIGIGADLRERKKLEAELTKAESASRAKDLFLANMSHEMRTPLNAIIGLIYLLSRTPLDPNQRDLLEKARLASGGLLALISDVLDLSKIEAGEMTLNPGPTPLLKVLQEAVQLASVTVAHEAIGVQLQAHGLEGVTVLMDALRMQQILSNLLGNAIKFTVQGEVVLRAEVLCDSPEAMRIRLEVQDNGPGIAWEQQQQLFTPFTQANPDVSRQFGGTGLGLSIVRHLVELMHGSVGLRSALGEGSTFWLELPLTKTVSPLSEQALHSIAGSSSRYRLAARNILVVDDSAINREVVRRILALEGARVEEAHSGEQALSRLADPALPIELLLLDLQMPGCDGVEVARQVRAMPHRASLPIFALTASALHSERERAMDSGMNAFVPKPFAPEELIQRIVQTLGAAVPTDTASDNASLSPALDTEAQWRHRVTVQLLQEWLPWIQNSAAGLMADRQWVQRQWHKLQGSAGMLGLMELRQAAHYAEQVWSETSQGQEAAAWARVAQALEQLAQDHARAPQDPPTAVKGPLHDQALGAQDISQLMLLLEQHSLDAQDLYERLRPAMARTVGAATLHDLDRAMGQLDFAIVMDKLRAISADRPQSPAQ